VTAAEAETARADGATVASRRTADRPPVTSESIIGVHPLSMRASRGSWIIGRADTGTFVQVPDVAHRILLLLSAQRTVGQVSDTLLSEGHEPADIADFIEDLADLDFIDAIDAHQLPQPDPRPPSLPWLKPRHTRWTLHPATVLAASAIIVAGIGCLAARPDLAPTYRSLVWSRWSGIVLAGDMAIAWALIFLHELSHLATARAAGVPARLSLGTRLQFLAAQTDVTGVWTQPRRIRLTVYLSGIVLDLVTASIGLIVLTAAGSGMPAIANRIIEATILLAVLSLPVELMVFMRTDIYFLLQDLTGCLNLYADGSAYFWYLIGLAAHRVRLKAGHPADPSLGLDPRERRAVRIYSVMLALGTVACLAVAIAAELPATALLLSRAASNLTATSPLARLGNGAVIALTGGFLAVWMRTWWQRHGHQVRRLLPGHRRRPEGGDIP
jgi:putative peptide zinc metalloprotease protein